mmetsp:Transcript_14527/g.35564  ORF Transcript_14527/g.35564 Transcript_14527/m.35564 type:complete len:234 (-) Transcript_14527:68-769(-)
MAGKGTPALRHSAISQRRARLSEGSGSGHPVKGRRVPEAPLEGRVNCLLRRPWCLACWIHGHRQGRTPLDAFRALALHLRVPPLHLLPPLAVPAEARGPDLAAGVVHAVAPVHEGAAVVVGVYQLVRERELCVLVVLDVVLAQHNRPVGLLLGVEPPPDLLVAVPHREVGLVHLAPGLLHVLHHELDHRRSLERVLLPVLDLLVLLLLRSHPAALAHVIHGASQEPRALRHDT